MRLIVDSSQMEDDRNDRDAVQRLAGGGIPMLVDTVSGLMHDKVAIIDRAVTLTGSFNWTWSAEHRNAENLIIIRDAAVASEYTQNWNAAAARSRALNIENLGREAE